MEKMSFGDVLREIRKQRSLSQKMLSQGICSQSVLSRIENNEELPNVLVMQQLCDRLNVMMDQVMTCHRYEAQKNQEIMDQIESHFFHEEYQELEKLLNHSDVLQQLYLDTDLQLYYYYEGSCRFYLHQDYKGALFSLKQGLSYTLQVDKVYNSAAEIQLISCIGCVYSALGVKEKAQEYLEKSMILYRELPLKRRTDRLIKIFFNYGRFLFDQEEYQASSAVVDEGIKAAHDKKSYYYLAELFFLKGELLLKTKKAQEAETYFSYSRKIREMHKI